MPYYIQDSNLPINNGGIAFKDGGCTDTIDWPPVGSDPVDDVVIVLGPSGRNDPCQFQCPISGLS